MILPEIQNRLRQKAEQHRDPELRALADEIGRRKTPGSRATTASRRMSLNVTIEILRMRLAFPELAQVDIAKAVNVNPGRVSEVLRGKRT